MCTYVTIDYTDVSNRNCQYMLLHSFLFFCFCFFLSLLSDGFIIVLPWKPGKVTSVTVWLDAWNLLPVLQWSFVVLEFACTFYLILKLEIMFTKVFDFPFIVGLQHWSRFHGPLVKFFGVILENIHLFCLDNYCVNLWSGLCENDITWKVIESALDWGCGQLMLPVVQSKIPFELVVAVGISFRVD